jgi:hypothetical protein
MSNPDNNGRPGRDPLEALLAKAGITMEELMALADGVELAPDREDAVYAALKDCPELIPVLRGFRFTNSESFRAPFDRVTAEPLPDRLLEPLRKREERPRATQPRRFRFGLPGFGGLRLQALAVAAVAAVALAIWLPGYFGGQSQEYGSFQEVLEKSPTGTVVQLARHLSMKPTMTYDTRLNRWCREYEFLIGDDAWQGGQACRESDGRWRNRHATHPKLRTAAEPPGKKVYSPASGPNGELEAARRAIIDKAPLKREDEAGVMHRGWERKDTP